VVRAGQKRKAPFLSLHLEVELTNSQVRLHLSSRSLHSKCYFIFKFFNLNFKNQIGVSRKIIQPLESLFAGVLKGFAGEIYRSGPSWTEIFPG